MAEDRAEDLRKDAHKLRGIANNLGATGIGACAEAIEGNVIAGKAVLPEQVDELEAALAVVVESLPTLLAAGQPAAAAGGADIDATQVFADLKQAVAAFDPGAVDLLDKLLAAQEEGSDMYQLLVTSRGFLNDFNFSEAEQLLASADQAAFA